MTVVDVPTPVRALFDAINTADMAAFVDAFTVLGTVDDWGRTVVGPAGLRAWASSDAIGANAAVTLLSAVTTGDVTEVTFDWRSTVFNGVSKATVTCQGDKVAVFRIPKQ